MSTTPNYGFKEQLAVNLCAVDAIDRELARIESKIDCRHEESGLSGHIADPCAHEALFERKVDQQEGHGLISDQYLEQIGKNKGEIANLQQENHALREKNEQLAAGLENKARRGVPVKHELEFAEGYTRVNSAEYFKTEDGQVTVLFKISAAEAVPVGRHVISHLPDGFKPLSYTAHSVISDLHFTGLSFACWVNPAGELVVYCHTEMPAGRGGFAGSITYFTA